MVGDVEFSEYNGSYEIELEIILNSLLRRGGQDLKILVGYAIEILPVLVLVDLRLLLLEQLEVVVQLGFGHFLVD